MTKCPRCAAPVSGYHSPWDCVATLRTNLAEALTLLAKHQHAPSRRSCGVECVECGTLTHLRAELAGQTSECKPDCAIRLALAHKEGGHPCP